MGIKGRKRKAAHHRNILNNSTSRIKKKKKLCVCHIIKKAGMATILLPIKFKKNH